MFIVKTFTLGTVDSCTFNKIITDLNSSVGITVLIFEPRVKFYNRKLSVIN